MDINTIVSSNWKEIKGQIRQKWGKLTEQDTETWKGNFEELSGKIQRAYGLTKDKVEEEFHAMVGKFNDSAQTKANGLKNSVDNYNDDLKSSKKVP